jgi:hypothetical protein
VRQGDQSLAVLSTTFGLAWPSKVNVGGQIL